MGEFMIKTFRGDNVEVIVEDNRILFNTDDVAYAVGYSSTRSLDKHIKGTKYDVLGKNGKRYITLSGIKHAAFLATKTHTFKVFADWATKFKKADLEVSTKPSDSWPLPTVTKPVQLFGIKEAAAKLGLSAKELGDWLVDQGHAGRYASNNSLYWKDNFESNGYGTRPIIGEGVYARESNIAKLTQLGFDFVKRRLESEREASVLSFAKKEANESEKLEKEIDQLIKNVFNDTFEAEWDSYNVSESGLLKKVKSIIAQVKLKEKD
jgi:hypothetical protein